MAYTTIDDPTANFQTVLWTGNGTNARTVALPGNTDMQPDWIWVKNLSDAEDHLLMDVVRTFAVDKGLRTNGGDEEGGVGTTNRGWVQATSNGFGCYDGDTNANLVNANSDTYVAWNWKAGTSFSNDASSTSVGSIDSVGSVNTTAGFSIISYTGTGATGTIAHGLGVVPKVIIIKGRSNSGSWGTYHASIGPTQKIIMNTTPGKASSGWMSNTAPTSSVFTVINDADVGTDGRTYIAYCFAEKQGYSKFSSYVGNGQGNANGTFVYTGFKPAFVLIKNADFDSNWNNFTGKIPGYNQINDTLQPNRDAAENGTFAFDMLSNGFKHRSGDVMDRNGDTHIYMAFAENPFVTSTGVPATAR